MPQWGQEGDRVLCMARGLLGSGMGFMLGHSSGGCARRRELRHCQVSSCDPCTDKHEYCGQQLDQKDGFVLLHCQCSTPRVLETRLWCCDRSQSLWVQGRPSDIGFPSSFCAGPVLLSVVLAMERITPSSPKCDYGPCCELDSRLAAAVAGGSPAAMGLHVSASILAQLPPYLPWCLTARCLMLHCPRDICVPSSSVL